MAGIQALRVLKIGMKFHVTSDWMLPISGHDDIMQVRLTRNELNDNFKGVHESHTIDGCCGALGLDILGEWREYRVRPCF